MFDDDLRNLYEKELQLFQDADLDDMKVDEKEAEISEGVDQKTDTVVKEFVKVLQGVAIDESSELILSLTKKDENGQLDFIYPITSSGFFEKHFHTIIDPVKYSTINFMKFFNYYWISYFSITNSILKNVKENKLQLDESHEKFIDLYDAKEFNKIIDEIADFTTFLYSDEVKNTVDHSSKNSYYSCIKTKLDKSKEFKSSGVLSSNYFNYVEFVDERIAYLNGELCLFEFTELLDVVDFNSKEVNWNPKNDKYEKIFFPFIFGQSMLKPIVSRKQIEAFSNAIDILDKADFLIILGYNINEDDNHINSLLRDFLKDKNKRIILLGEFDPKEIKSKLKIKGIRPVN